MNQNKFFSECEEYGKEIDRLTVQKDYVGLIAYLEEVEAFSTSHNTPEFAPIFYYLGTANSTLAGYFRDLGKAGQDTNKYRKQSLYYQRKSISLLGLV